MIRLVSAGAAGQPERWILAFRRTTDSRLINWLACGRYKHVSAFGYIREVDHWVFMDWRTVALDIIVARGTGATRLMNYYTRDADMLGMPARSREIGGPQFGLWCVPAVKQLVGIRGSALRPDALFRDCIRQGAEILSHESSEPAAGAARSDAARA